MSAKHRSLGVALLVALLAASAASAQFAPEESQWQNSWTGYMWFPGFQGNAVMQGNPVDVDVSVGDTIDALSDMEVSFSAHYEGHRRPWGVIADFMYWRMEQQFVHPDYGDVEVKPRQLVAEMAGAYTVGEKLMGDVVTQRTEALVGARYNMLKMSVSLEEGDFYASKSKNYVDPFVGARIFQALSDKWGVNLRADVGGFGIGSEMAVNVVGTLGYTIRPRNSILLGWRYYSQDYESGSGDSEFKWDVDQSGPFLAWQTRF